MEMFTQMTIESTTDQALVRFDNPIKNRILKIIGILRSVKKKLTDPENLHLSAGTAALTKINGIPVFLRPSYSDKARVRELRKDIYSGNAQLLKKIISKVKPTVLLDFGANIGLSSLALATKIPTIKTVVSVEAEQENFGVLKLNCKEWGEFFPDRKFHAIQGVISGRVHSVVQIANLGDGYSASGTFAFRESVAGAQVGNTSTSITPKQLIEKYKLEGQIIACKVDIEGGEADLFAHDTKWMENVAFLTMEIHDRFSEDTRGSSVNFLKAIIEHDFAIAPGVDTLYCYNRKYVFGLN
jgi:FkbM family methyltransferase